MHTEVIGIVDRNMIATNAIVTIRETKAVIVTSPTGSTNTKMMETIKVEKDAGAHQHRMRKETNLGGLFGESVRHHLVGIAEEWIAKVRVIVIRTTTTIDEGASRDVGIAEAAVGTERTERSTNVSVVAGMIVGNVNTRNIGNIAAKIRKAIRTCRPQFG
jgi:hypothetical protein